jgi:acetyl esterase/lipase
MTCPLGVSRCRARPSWRTLPLVLLAALAGCTSTGRAVTTATEPPPAIPAAAAAPTGPTTAATAVPTTVPARVAADGSPSTGAATVASASSPAELVVTRGLAYGPLPTHRLDLYRPAATTGPVPVVVYLHAGGWVDGGRHEVPPWLLDLARREGLAVASADYTLATVSGSAIGSATTASFPAAHRDVDRAIRWVRTEATAHGLDPERVLVAGTSSGGHLATMAGVAPARFTDPTLPATARAQTSRVLGAIVVGGISDLATFPAAGGWAPGLTSAFLGCPFARPDRCDPSGVAAASPVRAISSRPSAAYLVYGARDALVRPETQGWPLFDAWRAAHPDRESVRMQVVEDGDHNVGAGGGAGDIDVAAIEVWLDDVLAGS